MTADGPASLQPTGLEPEQAPRVTELSGAELASARRVETGRAPGRRRLIRRLIRPGLLFVLAGLLVFALRNAPLYEIWQVLARLQAWQMVVLLALNAFIYALVTARWWIVVHAEKSSVRYLPMIGVRIAVFAVSYFTFGPQIGGEPLQVLYLRKNYALSYTRAAASVVMDKLFELLGNFVLMALGLVAIFQSGLLSAAGSGSRWSLILFGLLISWPLVHILLLYHRIYPLSILLRSVGARHVHSKAARFVRAAEHLAGQFCQRHPRDMLGALIASLLAAAATVSEYALITSFLHINLPFWQLVTAWTSGWLSFLVPVPGGLGALEASQVSVLGFFGITAAAAISVTLLMRGRDLVIGGLGLLLAGSTARRV